MEPNKLEDQFKQKLDNRTIRPTAMAWDRLDAMLSVSEKKKPNRTWLFIAAAFLGLLLTGTLFLKLTGSTNTIDKGVETIVESPAPKTKHLQKEASMPLPDVQQDIKNTNAIAVAPAKDKKVKTIVAKSEVITVEQESIDVVNTFEQITPAAESEQLLANAEVTETVRKKHTVKIDANSLLSSVEGELNESFRKKALQTVARNYNVIKSSLANRNHK